ncbi:TPA: hypothetical protein NKO85_003840 [Vibrio parahaemolyticus]|nr:hypothetical protein [Vibrio parahaemolyticus]
MSISLKKAYAACLWLAERKLGIPVEEQRGEWDLEAKDKAFNWKREELVTALPYEYFENSIYDYHDELHHTSEVVIQLDDLDVDELEASKMNGETDIERLQETWESISEQVFTDLHQSDDEQNDDAQYIHCIDVSNIVSGNLFITEKLDNFVRYSPQRQYGESAPVQQDLDLAKAVPHTPQPYISLDDPIPTEYDKRVLANVIAHKTLLDLLSSDVFKASGCRDITSIKEALTQVEHIGYSTEDIPTSFWEAKPIPNYEISAVEQGINRISKINAALPLDLPISERFKIQENDYWIKNIQVSDNFASWLMERVRQTFPTPKTAVFKPQGKGFLVQFGTDKPMEVKSNNGVKSLYKLLKDHTTSSYKENFGYSLEMMGIDEMEGDISNYELSSPAQKRKSDNIRKYIRKQHSLIFWKLDQLKKHQLDLTESSVDKKEQIDNQAISLDMDKVKSSIFKRMNHIHSINQDDVTCLDKDTLYALIESDPESFVSNRQRIKEMIKVEMSEEEKSIDNTRNTINSAVKSIGKVAPHLAFYLGSAKSRSPRGIGYDNDLFYFASNDDIQWDFG